MVAKRGRREERDGLGEHGDSRCKQLYVEWINDQILLYSTGNHSQYLAINHNRIEYKKECACIIESLIAETNQHCKSTALQ